MKELPLKLNKRLQKRKEEDSFRKLLSFPNGIDFFSNDYLGFSRSREIFKEAVEISASSPLLNGATGSRLLSGNHPGFNKLEAQLAEFHNAPSALVFNSGYDANTGLFSAVPQKDDIILYDELAHASIRDGLKMSMARNFKFRHNDLDDLKDKLERFALKDDKAEVYIVTESVFSMDGDSPALDKITSLAETFKARLIVDEAHATGVIGARGEGLVQCLGLENRVFARIHTFGKAIGAHGAAILGTHELRDYLINFSRSFIYTTALSPHSVASISAAYQSLEAHTAVLDNLNKKIQYFKEEVNSNGLEKLFIESRSAIQVCLIPGNSRVKNAALELENAGFNVKPILSPTVPKGQERLRFCIHTYNSSEEISLVLKVLGNFVAKSE